MLPDIKLPLEYETNIASFMEKIEATPVVSFDDLEPFEAIEQLDFEVERYKPFQLPPVSGYEPKFSDKVVRPGCEYESAIRQRAGEPDLEQAQVSAHEQMELLAEQEGHRVKSERWHASNIHETSRLLSSLTSASASYST